MKDQDEVSTISDVTTQVETNDNPKALKRKTIDVLFDFVRSESELNPVLCGYFCKLVNTLITSQRKNFNLFAFDSSTQVISSLINHVYNRSIADLLIKILNQDVIRSDYKDEVLSFIIINDELKEQVLCQIIDQIQSEDLEAKLNASLVLRELIDAKKNFSFRSPIIHQRLFDVMKSGDDLVLRAGFQVLDTLYAKVSISKYGNGEEDNFKGGENKLLNDQIIPEIDQILQSNLPLLSDFIETYDSKTVYQSDFRAEQKSFGLTRIEAIKVMRTIVRLGIVEYTVPFIQTCKALMTFCVEYQWNSALHKLVEEILTDILRSNSKFPESFRTAFIEETQLVDFLSDLDVYGQHEQSQRVLRAGAVPSFIVIANVLDQNQSTYVKDTIRSNPKWQDFKESTLDVSNRTNNMALAGHQANRQEDDDDSDDSHYETSMDKLFQTFTAVKEAYDQNRLSESNSSRASEPEEEEKDDDEEVEIAVEPTDEDEETSVHLESSEEKPSSSSEDEDLSLKDSSQALNIVPSNSQEQQDQKAHVKSTLESGASHDEEVEVRKEFNDHSFWNTLPNLDINDLLADYI